MADNANVINPAANDQQPSAVQSLLAGIDQPLPSAPQAPTPTPVQANTSKWSGLVQGALLGLTGGLKAGLQNVQDAGTPRGPHANGLAMGEQEIQNDQARQQQQQQLNYEQQREQFSDQLAARRAQQQDIFNRARTAEANLHSLQLGLAIDNAPKDAQDAYYKDQNARLEDMETAQVPDLGVVTSLSALPTFLKAHNLSIGGIVPIHVRAADGSDEIHIFQNPDAPADVNAVNRTLKATGGQPIPAGSTISWRDAHSLIGQAQSRYATFLNQQSLQSQKDKPAMQRVQVEQNREDNRDGLGNGSGAALVDAIGQGKIAPERMSYLITRNPTLLQNVTTKYPDFDSTKAASYVSTYKDFTSGKTSVALNAGATALKHLQELQQLNTDASHIPGTSAYVAYQNKADTVASELARFYGTDTVPGIAAIKKTLTSTLPGNRDAAITTQAKSLGDKLDSFKQTWRNAAPSAAYQAPLPGIDLKAKLARAALDPDYAKTLTIQKSNFGRTRISEDGGKTWQVVQQ